MAPRNPLSKWTKRNFGTREERIKRIARMEADGVHEYLPYVFHGAEQLLKYGEKNNGRFIFIGQGMRPIFETMRAINEQDSSIPRNRIKYVVTPKSFILTRQNRKRLRDAAKTLEERLRARKIVTGKENKYLLVDIAIGGSTRKMVNSAIKAINPNAEIIWFENMMRGIDPDVGTKIYGSELMPRPTIKDSHGTNQRANIQEEVDAYLLFQQKLQEYLNERKR
ncbi:hypothetical protein IIC68_01105 [archaeon]|nr:hypothetical protein [archaeon]